MFEKLTLPLRSRAHLRDYAGAMSTRCYDTDLNDAAWAWIARICRQLGRVGGHARPTCVPSLTRSFTCCEPVANGACYPASSRARAPFTIIFVVEGEIKAFLSATQLAALSFRTIKYWSGFAGDVWSPTDTKSMDESAFQKRLAALPRRSRVGLAAAAGQRVCRYARSRAESRAYSSGRWIWFGAMQKESALGRLTAWPLKRALLGTFPT